jgi:hypothetical protein
VRLSPLSVPALRDWEKQRGGKTKGIRGKTKGGKTKGIRTYFKSPNSQINARKC